MNFCLPIEPSIGSTASRRYALKAQPKSEIGTPVKRRSMPLITRDGTERPTRVLARAATAACDVVAGLDRLDQPRDVLRLVLQIAVHRHHHVAARTRQAGVHRRMLSEVALEPHRTHAGIATVQALQRCEGAVRRAVVDEDQLERARAGIERRNGSSVELVHRRRLVEQGDDDRDVGRRKVRVGDASCLQRFGA